jgi:MSHA pilin protein MshC
MKNAQRSNNDSLRAQQGFTLVELITVVILLGILAIAVAPRFSDRSGYSEFSLQQRLIAALRNTQLKAMYDTRSDFCYRMILQVATNGNHQFGPSSASYVNGQQSNSCGVSIDAASDDFLRSEDGEIQSAGLQMQTRDGASAFNYIQFDNLGRPQSNAGSCASTCTVTFSGESDTRICVESQGYIYAC